jgi:ribosomal protein L35
LIKITNFGHIRRRQAGKNGGNHLMTVKSSTQINHLPMTDHIQYASMQTFMENLPTVLSDKTSRFISTQLASTLSVSNLEQLSFFNTSLAPWALFSEPPTSDTPANPSYCLSAKVWNSLLQAAEAKFHLFTHQNKLEESLVDIKTFKSFFSAMKDIGNFLTYCESEIARMKKS